MRDHRGRLVLKRINELNLSYNHLETLFINNLEHFLMNDKWLNSKKFFKKNVQVFFKIGKVFI
jgi:hypothetical protein